MSGSDADPAAGVEIDPGASIRDAACMIVIDRSTPEPRVLMGRRRETQIFLPNKWVFPGGRVDADDHTLAASLAHTDQAPATAVQGALAPELRAFALAGVRELLEEAGLAVAQRRADAVVRPLPNGWKAFSDLGLMPDVTALMPAARAITPPGRIRRYDTWFFMIDRAHTLDGLTEPDGELLDLGWYGLADAAALDLAHITRLVLADLADVLATARPAKDGDVPFYYHDGEANRRTRIQL